jgi:secretion/DNA translocation related TadE-like protein
MSGRHPNQRERGSATIWAVGAIAVLFLVAAALVAVGAVVETRHRAGSAADLAALAAAGYAPDGLRAACDRARWVAEHMHVDLTSCRLAGWDALVEVRAAPPDLLRGFGPVAAHARAGPVDR